MQYILFGRSIYKISQLEKLRLYLFILYKIIKFYKMDILIVIILFAL